MVLLSESKRYTTYQYVVRVARKLVTGSEGIAKILPLDTDIDCTQTFLTKKN